MRWLSEATVSSDIRLLCLLRKVFAFGMVACSLSLLCLWSSDKWKKIERAVRLQPILETRGGIMFTYLCMDGIAFEMQLGRSGSFSVINLAYVQHLTLS